MKKSILLKCLLVGVMTSVSALADMSVDKSNGVLTITSDISGMVIAKIIGPNDEVVVDEKYEGNSFSWTPSGMDGAYRYDVRVLHETQKESSATAVAPIDSRGNNKANIQSDYAGGSIEVHKGIIKEKEIRKIFKQREVSK